MRRDPEARYLDSLRHELAALREFIEKEKSAAESLREICRIRKNDPGDDVYRALIFFLNEEYRTKPGALALLYQTGERLKRELPASTKETILDLTRHRFRTYCAVLRAGGYA